jgi:hypothetical protein
MLGLRAMNLVVTYDYSLHTGSRICLKQHPAPDGPWDIMKFGQRYI